MAKINQDQGSRLRGYLDAVVLSILEQGRESHGYAITERLRAVGVKINDATVYSVLDRLAAEGLVKSQWEKANSGRNGPRRHHFKLTAKGKEQLQKERENWKEFVATVEGIFNDRTKRSKATKPQKTATAKKPPKRRRTKRA